MPYVRQVITLGLMQLARLNVEACHAPGKTVYSELHEPSKP